ncbi:hypothetical protein [Dyella mobilis]|uniref:MotA/TolQ/ExbB proton channel domain-containing protein n=1 Tax=Dyella mobilis TaxID=1849582 RepID=A0ABS2KF08_9GAMM|nr:hypothetical protein [Dyella mobilis]MBM7129445.1 hypothetical protein [Dyella mobilis]GLQ98290.1 hypothetical protein GCM10007863_27100 [Dyella mobilis]
MEKLEAVFAYVTSCTPYSGEREKGLRRKLEKIGNVCLAIGGITLLSIIVAGAVNQYVHPFSALWKDVSLCVGLFGELVMFVFIPVHMWLGVLMAYDRKKKRVKPFEVAVREHDFKNANPLTQHSVGMLECVQKSIQIQCDRFERKLAVIIGKDTAIVALLGIAVASMKNVGDVQGLLTRLKVPVISQLSVSALVAVALFLSFMILIASLIIRFRNLKKAYALDILDLAIKLKNVYPQSTVANSSPEHTDQQSEQARVRRRSRSGRRH